MLSAHSSLLMIIKHSRFPNFLPINNYIVARGSFRQEEEEWEREREWREMRRKKGNVERENGESGKGGKETSSKKRFNGNQRKER